METRKFLKYMLLAMTVIVSLGSCEKKPQDKGLFDEAQLKMADATINLDLDCGNTVDLVAGRDLQVVGTVTVRVAFDKITVTYSTNEGWLLTETHLHFFSDDTDFADIKLKGGNAAPGQFDYKMGHDYLNTYVYEVENNIPVLEHLYVAAHAVVASMEGGACERLDELEARLPASPVGISFQYTKTNSYYNITLSNADEFNGDHLGWCIDNNGMPIGYPLANIISSYSSDIDLLAQVVPSPENLDLLNYLMNTWFPSSSFPVIQASVWRLMNGVYSNPSGGISLTSEQMAAYELVMNDVFANGEGFVPECSDNIVILLDSGDRSRFQNVFILTKRNAYPGGDETAWGMGIGFPGANWSMYFRACN